MAWNPKNVAKQRKMPKQIWNSGMSFVWLVVFLCLLCKSLVNENTVLLLNTDKYKCTLNIWINEVWQLWIALCMPTIDFDVKWCTLLLSHYTVCPRRINTLIVLWEYWFSYKYPSKIPKCMWPTLRTIISHPIHTCLSINA